MKVIMVSRDTLYLSPGGDSTQILMTIKYLKALGVEVDIKLSSDKIDYTNYDLIHFFNIIRPDDILPHINHKVPIVISTIYVDYSEYEKRNKSGIGKFLIDNLKSGQIEYIKAIARWLKNGDRIKSKRYLLRGHNSSIRSIAARANLLLPNSHSEYKRVVADFNIATPYNKVVNAINPAVFDVNITANTRFQNHVLCVGRIEGRKNQLNLIRALKDEDIQLTIIGKPSPNHLHYYRQCKNLAATVNNVHFLDHISHEELVAIYKAAKVHVLPSWFETTGLSSLEAGVMGCNVVVTKKGDTEEYFGDMAYYCEPDDVVSIKEAVLKAYNAPANLKLQEYILNNYTWQHTAEQTLKAYQSVLLN